MLSAVRAGSFLRLFCQTCRRNAQTQYMPYASYQSKYNIQNLYPNASTSESPSSTTNADQVSKNDNFTGHIPVDQLTIQYSRSSGPGGQHVNKVNTKVEIRFKVQDAVWIPDWIKPKLMEQERSRLTKEGELVVTSQKTRKQLLNQADCMAKVREMVWQAAKSLQQPQPSPEDLQLLQQRKEKAIKEMLREKRQHSLKKSFRQQV